MLDTAAILMSHGEKVAYGYAEGVNDNMCQSHFHEFFELYYLESGERHHMIEGELYHLTAHEFIIFPPNVMHHSYGDKNVPFKRIVLYFTPDMIVYPEVRSYLLETARVFSLKKIKKSMIHLLLSMLHTELDKEEGLFQKEYLENLLNQLLLTILRADYTPVEAHPEQDLHRRSITFTSIMPKKFLSLPWLTCSMSAPTTCAGNLRKSPEKPSFNTST